MNQKKLQGLFTALITPFRNGKIDEKAFQSHIEWQVAQGVHGLVPCGTTGESPTLTYDEHERVIALCVEAAAGRVAVMAGTGANSTEEAVMFTRGAKNSGADAALVVAPYYNKPTQEGLFQHYKAINDAVELPVIVYNIPGRSVVNITDDTLARMAALPNIVGIKDATGDLARVSTLRAKVGSGFTQFSGEDMTAIAFNAMGGVGCISVTSNIAPAACAAIQNATLKGDYAGALAIHDTLVDLHTAMFCETSPAPVKYAASLMGLCTADLRLPLCGPSDENKKRIEAALKSAKLI